MTAAVSPWATVRTDRLSLTPAGLSDLDELWPIFSDPRGWWFDPAGCHLDRSVSRRWLDRCAARWAIDRLSYWTIRLAETDEVVGVGGAQRHPSHAWNLFYRLGTEHWGHGYATELSWAALDAAHHCDPLVPVVAWIVEHNEASKRVAQRVGLVDYGLRIDDSDGQLRRAYADRPLDDRPDAREFS